MASRVTIRADRTKQLAKAVERATARALNRGIIATRTDVLRRLAAETGLRQKTIKARLHVQRATPARLEATLTVTGQPVPLIEFGAKQTPQGVTSGPRGALLRGAFLAKMRSGHKGVYTRKGPSRSRRGKPRGSPGLPIRERFGPPLPQVAVRQRILQSALVVGEAAFQKNLKHELGRELGGS